jgi:hypothetical protein
MISDLNAEEFAVVAHPLHLAISNISRAGTRALHARLTIHIPSFCSDENNPVR